MNNLKENIKVSAVIAAVVIAAVVNATITNKIYQRGEKRPSRVSYDTFCYPEYIEQRDSVLWEAMIDSTMMAVAEVKSGRDSLARNGVYWGPLQIGPPCTKNTSSTRNHSVFHTSAVRNVSLGMEVEIFSLP